jgi:hypothetical protein
MPRHLAEPSRPIWPPEPGTFALRRARRGWRVPAQIGRDDAGRWYAIIDGVAGESHPDPAYAPDVDRIWTAGIRIPQADYDYLLALKSWAVVNDPEHPCLSPFEPIDPRRLRPLAPR